MTTTIPRNRPSNDVNRPGCTGDGQIHISQERRCLCRPERRLQMPKDIVFFCPSSLGIDRGPLDVRPQTPIHNFCAFDTALYNSSPCPLTCSGLLTGATDHPRHPISLAGTMSTKRPHPSSSSTSRPAPNAHPKTHKRRKLSPTAEDEKPSTQFRKNNAKPQQQPKKNPINPLKSRIRSLNRQLAHSAQDASDKTPAGIQVARERELAALKIELEDAELEARRKKMIGKWHMVRFFERRRAERKLGRLKKEMKGSGEAADAKAGRDVHDAEVDLMYTLYFPLDLPYVSLWPKGKKEGKKSGVDAGEEAEDGDVDGQSRDEGKMPDEKKGDPEMWKLVEKSMEEGKLDALRNGKLMKRNASSKESNGQASKGVKKAVASNKHAVKEQAEAEESDEGFFE